MPELYLRLRITDIIKETPDAYTYHLENTGPEPVVYQAGQFPSIEILFQIKGQVVAGGAKYGPETGYEFLPNEGPVPVEAVEPTEFLRAVLHQF